MLHLPRRPLRVVSGCRAPGACVRACGPALQEYCDASLHAVLGAHILHEPSSRRPNMDLVLTVLIDIAKGMEYIHKKNIIHGGERRWTPVMAGAWTRAPAASLRASTAQSAD